MQALGVMPAHVLALWQIHLCVALEHLGTREIAEVVICQGDGGHLQAAVDTSGAGAWTQQEVSPELPARHVAIVSPAVAQQCC